MKNRQKKRRKPVAKQARAQLQLFRKCHLFLESAATLVSFLLLFLYKFQFER